MKLRLGVLIKCKFNRIHGLEFHLDNVMFAAGRVNYHFFFNEIHFHKAAARIYFSTR